MSLIRKLEQIMELDFGRDCANDVPEGYLGIPDMSTVKMLSVPESSPLHGYVREILKHATSEYAKLPRIEAPPTVSFYSWDLVIDSIDLLREITQEAKALRGGTEGGRVAVVSFKDDYPLMLVAIDGDDILASMMLAPMVDEEKNTRLKEKIKSDFFKSEEGKE